MRRFFIDPAAVSDDKAVLSGDEARHIRTVLRLKPSEIITLFDGKGMTYTAKIEEISRENVRCIVLSSAKVENPGPTIHLGQALLTGRKMDLICQKTTELGISSIQPFVSERCMVRKKSTKQIYRWQRITMEACKQSDQPILPEVFHPIGLSKLLSESAHYEKKLVFYEVGEQTRELNELFNDNSTSPPPSSLFFLIGPEGGFTSQEISQARKANFTPISMGKQILRADTASIAATAILQFLLGNLQYKTPGDHKK